MNEKEIWSKAKEELEQTVPTFKMWIEPLEASAFDGNVLTLITAHALAPQAIKSQHDSKILDALKNAYGQGISYSILYDEEFAERYQKEKKKELQKAKRALPETEESKLVDNLAQMQSSANLNLKYKFSNFVVGENSRFAHAAAFTVAQNPAKKYNPLFIYGASGLGKTHLMQAIGHYVIFNKPKLRVKYIKTEEYVNELIKNIQCGGNDRNTRMDKFRQKYRNVDVLLIDDIQFLESKTYTMEEIFHTFDSLHNNNKQIVITSTGFEDIPTLPDRLSTF
ncbi:MAG: DnaA ATPase domain-containing protein [Candidatus Gastranaerophilaceae bacterium]